MRLSSAREERREVGIMVSSVASSPKCKRVMIMKTDQICNSPRSGKIQESVTKLNQRAILPTMPCRKSEGG